MIPIKLKTNFNIHEFKINYYEIESITDFDYLVILITNDCIENGKDLGEEILKFTNGKNDLELIMRKRFESLFSLGCDKFMQVSEQARKMAEQTKKLIPSSETKAIPFEPNLELYLIENEFVSKIDAEQIIEGNFKKSNNVQFNKIDIIKTDEMESISIDGSINLEFEKINLLNIDEITNEILLEESISQLKLDTEKFESFDKSEIQSVVKYKEGFTPINRNYGTDSIFQLLGSINSIEKGKSFEYDYSDNGKYISTEFILYKEVILTKEEKIQNEIFKSQKIYDELLSYINSNVAILPKKYLEKFVSQADSKKEFEIISNNNLYPLNKKASFEMIEKMIEFGVNIITDDIVAKSEFFDFNFSKNPLLTYEYLTMFFEDDKFGDISESKKIRLLHYVFETNSSMLNKQEYEYIESMIKESNLINETINNLINEVAGMRSYINDGIEKRVKLLEEDKDLISDKIDDELSQLKTLKRIANFMVHIRDPHDKKFDSDLKATKKYNELLPQLKKDISNLDKDSIGYAEFNKEYIAVLENLKRK